MNRFQGQRGYTLFLTILMIVIFSILSVTLITTTLSGAKRSEVREDVTQAGELAEKGLKHITSQINNDLNEKLAIGGRSKTDFKVDLLGVLNTYECVPNTKIIEGDGPTGSYEACIEDWKDSADNPLQKEVTISSTGVSTEKEKTLETILLIGAEEAPVPLKYALSSTKSLACEEDPNECFDGEGNMFLHGGITVTGDMKVDGNLIVADTAFAPTKPERSIMKEGYWVESVLPEIKESELDIAGDIYRYNLPNDLKGKSSIFDFSRKVNEYNKHLRLKEFDKPNYDKLTNINDGFLNKKGPNLEKHEVFQNNINIKKIIDDFSYTQNDPNVHHQNSADFKWGEGIFTFKDIRDSKKLYGFYCAKGIFRECFLDIKKSYDLNFYLVGDKNKFHQFAVKRDLHIGREIAGANVKVTMEDQNNEQGGLYVGRNLTIGRGITSDLEAATSKPNVKVELDGNVYVNGNLEISGVDGKFNSIMYVNGDVTIERSTISKLNKDGKVGNLIIFANGNINITKNSLFDNNPSVIDGYFFSNKSLEINGVASNFIVRGGISAPRIVANSIRGRAGIGGPFGLIRDFKPSQHYVTSYYEESQNQPERNSRLIIEYDSTILETYSNLSNDDHVYNIVPTTILERIEK